MISKNNFLSATITFLFSVAILTGQQSGPAITDQSLEDVFWESLQKTRAPKDSLVLWQEQVLLHTDKDILEPKEHLFFKAYVLTGPEQLRVSASDVLKVELLNENGQLVNSQYHKVVDGAAEGSFKVPKKTKSGKHYLRAYTRWMLNYGPENFAVKAISVRKGKLLSSVGNLDFGGIEVFPEGGNLIVGLENRIAVGFEKLGETQISVVDENNNEVAKVQHYGGGLGTFLLKPKVGERYSLLLNKGRKIPLPNSNAVGYTLRLNTIDDSKVVAKVASTKNLKDQDIYLRGRINGIKFFESKVDFNKNNEVEIDIPKGKLPNGVLRLQLEDDIDQVWASRPLHISNNELRLQIEETSNVEGRSLKIKVTDTEGMPVQTELSVALGQNKTVSTSKNSFDSVRNQRFLNDLLVLTNQLPADYALNKITELPDEIRYNFQKGLEFYGRAYDLDAVPLTNTKIQIVVSGEGEAEAYEVVTNEEGLFELKNLQIEGEADMVFRRVAEEDRDKFVKVVPYQYETPPLNFEDKNVQQDLRSKQFIPKKQTAEFKPDENAERLVTLEGVTLIGEKLKAKRTPSIYNIEPDRVTYQNPERPRTIPELFLGIPGVQVVGLGSLNPRLVLPRTIGGGPTLWVIDGLPLIQPTSLNDIMSLVPFFDVDRIELLLGANATIYGTRGAGGVILMYTRNGRDENYFNRKKARLTFEGFHDSLSFDTYREQLNAKRGKTENNTVYWNPSLKTDENGEAVIELPKLSESGEITFDVKAITPDGKNGSLKTIY